MQVVGLGLLIRVCSVQKNLDCITAMLQSKEYYRNPRRSAPVPDPSQLHPVAAAAGSMQVSSPAAWQPAHNAQHHPLPHAMYHPCCAWQCGSTSTTNVDPCVQGLTVVEQASADGSQLAAGMAGLSTHHQDSTHDNDQVSADCITEEHVFGVKQGFLPPCQASGG
jgi:hypothetical protein